MCSAECLGTVCLIFGSSLFQHELSCKHKSRSQQVPKWLSEKMSPTAHSHMCHLYESCVSLAQLTPTQPWDME